MTDNQDWVVMTHPDIEGTSTVTRKAFETVWREQDWVEADPLAPVIAEALGHEASSLGALNREELDTVARHVGLDPTGLSNKGEVETLINQTLNPKE